MKKNLICNSILIISLTGLMFFVRAADATVSRLNVQFEQTPLFNETNFLPGKTVTRWVKVINNTDSIQKIITEAINENNTDNFAKEFNLVIREHNEETNLWSGTLATFFDAGEIPLSDLSNGAEKQYNFSVSFNPKVGNSYQGKNLGFDFLVGFQGQENNGGNNTGGGNSDGIIAGSGGSSGGGTSAVSGLLITGESVADITQIAPEAATLTITWQTNYSASSQIIYGLDNGNVYQIDLSAPNYGYPNATVDDLTKVTNHSVTITGLVPGATYRYRVVSHASPATVSYEHIVTIPVTDNKKFANNAVLSLQTSISENQSNGINYGNASINTENNNQGENNSIRQKSAPDAKINQKNKEELVIKGTNKLLANVSNYLTLGTSNNWVAFIVLFAILVASYMTFSAVFIKKKKK